jgi:DNA-binding MarR family transcriptional regulator
MMASTRPAVARSPAGRSPHSRWVIWLTAALIRLCSSRAAPVTVTAGTSPVICSSCAAAMSPTCARASASLIFSAPAALTAKPSWLISEVSRLAHPLITDRLATAGSRGYHYRLLAALAEFGPASQASLGRRTAMDRSDVAAAVNELVGRGLAGRAPDPADRRRNVVSITPAGTAHLGRLEELLAGVQDDLLAPLSPAERRQLISLLDRILEHHA